MRPSRLYMMIWVLACWAAAERVEAAIPGFSLFLNATPALFGYLPYGSKMQVRLVRPVQDPLLCQDEGMRLDGKALLVLRGGCRFVDKARLAQRQGAGLMLVMDNLNSNTSVSMVADGYTQDIQLPCLFIQHLDGKALLSMLHNDSEVRIKLNFTTFQRVVPDISLFMAGSVRLSYGLLRGLGEVWPLIAESSNLTLAYESEPLGSHDPQMLEDCLFEGQYCLFHHHQPGTTTGQTILRQQLLEYNIFLHFQPLYVAFLEQFDQHCAGDYRQYEQCSQKVFAGLANPADYERMAGYVDEGFLLGGNPQLADQRALALQANIRSYPAVVVNGAKMRGNLSVLP